MVCWENWEGSSNFERKDDWEGLLSVDWEGLLSVAYKDSSEGHEVWCVGTVERLSIVVHEF